MNRPLRSAVPSGGSAPAGDLGRTPPAGASFPVGSHVCMPRAYGGYYVGKVIGKQVGNRRIEWSDGVVTRLPARKLQPHGVETELGWEEE